MIIQIPNFFDPRLCNFLITYFHEAKRTPHEPGVELVKLFDNCHSESIKKLYNTLARHGMEYYGNGHYLQNWEIVRRAAGNHMKLHKDFEPHDHTMIVYLNDHFTGGEVHVEGVDVPVEVGKAVTFSGNKMEHGVNEIHGAPRYVLTAWWSPL